MAMALAGPTAAAVIMHKTIAIMNGRTFFVFRRIELEDSTAHNSEDHNVAKT